MQKINVHRLQFEWRRINQMNFCALSGKVIIKLLSLTIGLLMLPITLVLHAIGYRHVTVFTDRIGHLALEPDCLLKEQALGNIPHRKWIMLAPPGRVANEHLLSYWQPHFRIVRDKAVCLLIASMSRWGLMRYDIDHYIRAIGKAQAAYRVYSEWGSRPPLLQLTSEDDTWCDEMLEQLGIPKDAWFVCVHAREAGFSPIDEELHNHRNSHIENTFLAIAEIVRRGGWVVRMGDPSMHPLPQLKQVLDYAHHPNKSSRMDVLLCAKAKFFLGNSSGITFLSSAFGVPCALANLIPIATLGFNDFDISIPKLIRSQASNRYLRFNETLNSAIANYQYASLYKADDLDVVENSADDIFLLVSEMLDRLEEDAFKIKQISELQYSIQRLFRNWHFAFGSASQMSARFLLAHRELMSESDLTNYTLSSNAIYLPHIHVQHRDEEYKEAGFETLGNMQERHFWYRGRHRFLLEAVNRYLPTAVPPLSAIDLGGGAGGWLRYLTQHQPEKFGTLALADSSVVALTMAASVLPLDAQRYHVDLMQLNMHEQWDAAFLLDVIEHLPDDLQALRQAREALKPGGFLFVTTPAFPQYWSHNDDIAQHLRRYRRRDFVRLAPQAGLTLCDSRYFMFYLSPLYLLNRWKPRLATMTPAQQKELFLKQHQVPSAPVNSVLSMIFAAETPLGHYLRFPWGTSILGIFRRV